jgi:hypothetical protein
MRVSGFGKVPHRYDAATGLVTYQIPQRLRLEQCGVQVSFKHDGKDEYETIGWGFQVKRIADYLSSDATVPGLNDALPPEEETKPENSPTASL